MDVYQNSIHFPGNFLDPRFQIKTRRKLRQERTNESFTIPAIILKRQGSISAVLTHRERNIQCKRAPDRVLRTVPRPKHRTDRQPIHMFVIAGVGTMFTKSENAPNPNQGAYSLMIMVTVPLPLFTIKEVRSS